MSEYAFPQQAAANPATVDPRVSCPNCQFKMIATHTHSTCPHCGLRFSGPSQLELVLAAFGQMRTAFDAMAHKFDELIEAHRKAHEPAPRD